MVEYFILTENLTADTIQAIRDLDTPREHHINRTRFYLDLDDAAHCMFMYKYSDIIHCVTDTDHLKRI
jgi:hypothetical protein